MALSLTEFAQFDELTLNSREFCWEGIEQNSTSGWYISPKNAPFFFLYSDD